MALLVFPPFLPLTSLSPDPSSRPRTRLHCSSPAMSSACARTESSVGETAGTAVLWFKHDLRVDDHPGLVDASRFRTVVPLYVFDRRILSRFSDEMLELLLFALEDLTKSLKDRGSGLVIRREENFKHYLLILLPFVDEEQVKPPTYLLKKR